MTRIIGHRGARGQFPENTLEGFRLAIEAGILAFEIDIGITKDGVPVLHHDPALNTDVASLGGRHLSGSLPLIKDIPYDELQDFDIGRLRPGSDYAAKYPSQTPIEGCRIPTLAQTLALDPRVVWTIELKLMPDRPDWTVAPEAMVETVLSTADAAAATDRIILQSFDWRAPRYCRHIRPDVARAWLTQPDTTADAPLWWDRPAGSLPEVIAEEGGGTWAPRHDEVTEQQVIRAHKLGIQVAPWTVNDQADMDRLAAWGVDAIITDYPIRSNV
jgi:glycerophosphoryl diester phosphodiesterase